jgi:glycosyltransferase involved in cell wall biosynthesis
VPFDVSREPVPQYRMRSGSVFWPGYENRGMFTTGLVGAFRAANPDVLHLWEEPFSVMALQALLLRRLLAPRAAAVFFSSDNLTRQGRYPYRPSWFYSRVERFAYRECEAGSAVSEEVEEVLRIKGYRGPIEVIPHGIQLEDFPERTAVATTESSRFTIGYVGRLLEQKGIATLLGAFAEIAADRGARPTDLILVGDGPDRGRFGELARALGLEGRARFLPGVSHSEVARVYRGLDVLVVPSRTTSRWKEQFGRVLIEGMAAGCALIGSSSGAIPGVIGDAGLVFPEGDAPALASALRRLRDDPDLANVFRDRGRQRVREKYTWDAVVDSVLRLYDRALSVRARGREIIASP